MSGSISTVGEDNRVADGEHGEDVHAVEARRGAENGDDPFLVAVTLLDQSQDAVDGRDRRHAAEHGSSRRHDAFETAALLSHPRSRIPRCAYPAIKDQSQRYDRMPLQHIASASHSIVEGTTARSIKKIGCIFKLVVES